MEEDLLEEFDGLIERKGFSNRSEAIRSLIRDLILEDRVRGKKNAEVIGTITLVYDHSSGDLSTRLVKMQHRFHEFIVSTLHVHFDEQDCLEVLVVKGKNERVREISDVLIGTRGVRHGSLIIESGLEAGHVHKHAPEGGHRH